MNTHLAIAAVTATLRQVLYDSVGADVGGMEVTILAPDDPYLKNDSPRLNLFLYQVTPSAAWRNVDVPGLREDGTLVSRKQVGLDLHYLLTAYGKSTATNPEVHAVLGSAVRTLHEKPVLTRQTILKVVSSLDPYLRQSDLADQLDLVKLTLQPLSLEELSKLWSVFFQTPYRPSVGYQASVVVIEGKKAPRPALPVRDRDVYVRTFKQPVIERVFPASGEYEPILSGATVIIAGTQLEGDVTRLIIDGQELSLDTLSQTQATFQLPQGLKAGVHALQITQKTLIGRPPTPHSGIESNVAAFIVCPRIVKITLTGSAHMGELRIELTPPVGRGQRAVLLLNQIGTTQAESARYSLAAEPRGSDDPPEQNELFFKFERVQGGTYLVRVQVDGAESALNVVDETYDAPKVSIA